jgi:hypothetical protein
MPRKWDYHFFLHEVSLYFFFSQILPKISRCKKQCQIIYFCIFQDTVLFYKLWWQELNKQTAPKS